MSLEVSGIEAAIQNTKVLVFSKSYCPFAGATKQMFQQAGVEMTIFELDQMGNGGDLQNKLAQLTNQRTVPNVFIGGKHVGGNDNCQAAKSNGQLKTMLTEAGVSHNL